jgi:hypothetical protein
VSSRHSSSHDLVENILDSGLPSDEVALHVGCEEIVALAQDFRNLFEQLEAERRDRKWWAAASSRERQRLLERYGMKPTTVTEWDAMAPEEQDALIASGWHPGPGAYSDRALQVRYARRDRDYWKQRARHAEQALVDLHESLFIGSERGLSKEALGQMATFAKTAALAVSNPASEPESA